VIFRAIGDPDISVCGDADAHQSARFAGKRYVALLADRATLEIMHSNCSVETRDPHLVGRHACAPPDAVYAHRMVKIFKCAERSRSSMMDVEDEHNHVRAAFGLRYRIGQPATPARE
jgi:hypothetical protein